MASSLQLSSMKDKNIIIYYRRRIILKERISLKERKMKIAIGQFEQVHGDTDANTEKMLNMIEEAASKNSDIIIFPELAYSGYRLESEEMQKLAEPVDGPFVQLLRNKAKEHRIHIMSGYAEADKVIPGRMYNSLVFIDDEGNVLENMRKVYAWGEEKLKFREGKRLPVVDTKFGKIGLLICYDMEHPEPARIEALKGAEIIFNASFWSIVPAERRWHVDLAANALFNLLYMVGANAVGENLCGSSMVVGPDGEVVNQASRDEEEVLITEIDLNRVLELRSTTPYLNDFKDELFSMDAVEKY